MAVGSSVVLAEWFQNKEMALAMALQVAISRIGSVVNNVLSPAVANSTSVPTALWFGMLVCAGSLACTMVLYPIDKARETEIKKEVKEAKAARRLEAEAVAAASVSPLHSRERARTESVASVPPVVDTNPLAGCVDVKKFSLSFWLLAICCVVTYGCVIPFNSVAASLFMERDYFKPQTSGKCALQFPDQCQSSTNVPNEWCEKSSVWQPPLPDFIKEEDIVCTDKKWKSSTGKNCAKVYCDGEKDAEKTVALIFSIPFFISAFASPFLGGSVDFLGGRGIVCLFSALMLVAVHSLLGYSEVSPYLLMTGQGLAYSMFAAALWPSVPYLVPEKSVGIAYGVVTAVQNAGLAGVPLMVSGVYNASGERYIPSVELLFTILALGGALSALLLNFTSPQLNWKSPPSMPDPDAPDNTARKAPRNRASQDRFSNSTGVSLKGDQHGAYVGLQDDI